MLEDAWVPPKIEMRDAVSGDLITEIPLGEPFANRFGQPYAVTHRADIHGVYLRACQGNNLVSLETNRKVEDFVDEGDEVALRFEGGEEVRGRALIGADGMWSKVGRIVGDGAPRVSGHIAYRAVLKREEVPDDLWRPDIVLWAGPKTHFVHYPLRRGTLYNLVAVFHSDRYVEGWNSEGDPRSCFAVQGRAAGGDAASGAHRDVANVGLVRPRAGEGLVEGPRDAARRCRPSDAAISRPGRLHGKRGRRVSRRKRRGEPGRRSGAFKAYEKERYLRTGRVQLMARVYGEFYPPPASRGAAHLMLSGRTPQQSWNGMAWLYGGS